MAWLTLSKQGWTLGLVAMIATAVGLGLGLRLKAVSASHVALMIKLVLAVDLFYVWGLVWSKISLLLLYYRVFRFGYIKCAGQILGGVVVAWAVTATVLVLVNCASLGTSPRLAMRCTNADQLRLSNAVASMVTDVMIVVLPLSQIWGLQSFQTAEKMGLTAIFGMGLLSVTLPLPT